MFVPIANSIVDDSLLQAMSHLSLTLLQLADVVRALLIVAASFLRSCTQQDSYLGY